MKRLLIVGLIAALSGSAFAQGYGPRVSGGGGGGGVTLPSTSALLKGDGVGGASAATAADITDANASLLVKPAVAVVATSNLTLSGEQTIDGQLTSGSLVLATAQTAGAENGPWVSAAGAWARPTWYTSGSTTQAPRFLTTFARLGTTYQGSTWRMTTASVTIDTTATTWTQTPTNVNSVTGTLSGSSVSGGTFGAVNGSALTSLSSANLTGALPAISGASLTSVTHAADWDTTTEINTATTDDDFVTLTGAQTLTLKTFTAPKFADLGFIADPSGNELLIFDQVASAVNELTLANAATSGNPTISATGGDSNIGINLVPKGTGGVRFPDGAVATPSITFNSSPTTGFRYTSSGIVFCGASANIWFTSPSVIEMRSNGTYAWSASTDPTASADTALARKAVAVTAFEGATSAGGTWSSVPKTPTQIAADTNNYNPGGTAYYQRWSTDASRSITGLVFTSAQVDGQTHVIANAGSNNIVIVNESASSTAANRFHNSTGADITLAADAEVNCWYDATTARWRVTKRGF